MRRVAVVAPRVDGDVLRRFAMFGPLIGGLPYAWTVIAIPFAYAIGIVPALIAGLAYGAWRHTQGARRPGARWRLAVGAASGAFAAALVGLAFGLADGLNGGLFAAGVVAAHGIPAAAILALAERRRAYAFRSMPSGATGSSPKADAPAAAAA